MVLKTRMDTMDAENKALKTRMDAMDAEKEALETRMSNLLDVIIETKEFIKGTKRLRDNDDAEGQCGKQQRTK